MVLVRRATKNCLGRQHPEEELGTNRRCIEDRDPERPYTCIRCVHKKSSDGSKSAYRSKLPGGSKEARVHV